MFPLPRIWHQQWTVDTDFTVRGAFQYKFCSTDDPILVGDDGEGSGGGGVRR